MSVLVVFYPLQAFDGFGIVPLELVKLIFVEIW